MGQRLFRKHRTSKNWTFVKTYRTKKAAEKHASGIRNANVNYRTLIIEVKETGSDTRKSGDRF